MLLNLRPIIVVAIGIAICGCFRGDRAADRTLKVYQFQDTRKPGPFQIDVSRLHEDAIESHTDSGEKGTPVTSLVIKTGYPVKIVFVPSTETETKTPVN
jgi:hypothetical protein